MNDDAMGLLLALGNNDARYIEEARPKDMPICSDNDGGGTARSLALKAKKPVSARLGEKRVCGSFGKTLRFEKLSGE